MPNLSPTIVHVMHRSDQDPQGHASAFTNLDAVQSHEAMHLPAQAAALRMLLCILQRHPPSAYRVLWSETLAVHQLLLTLS
jgi:hypothetical protein